MSVVAEIERDEDSVLNEVYVKANVMCNCPIEILKMAWRISVIVTLFAQFAQTYKLSRFGHVTHDFSLALTPSCPMPLFS